MTIEQQQKALKLIELYKINDGYLSNDKIYHEEIFKDTMQKEIVLRALEELNIIEYFNSNKLISRLTEIGYNFESFDTEKNKEIKESEIRELTIKQLKGNIFQLNKWWLLLIINAIISILCGVLLAILTK